MNSRFSMDLAICTYNNAALLEQTLLALERLQPPAHCTWQVVVVNNRCTDNTTAVVNAFINRQRLPLYLVEETRQGLTPARLCAVRWSVADWLAFVDDDCLLEPDWLQAAEQFILSHPTCKLFGSKVNLRWQEPPPPYVHQFPFAYAAKNHGTVAKPVASVAGAGMVVNRQALYNCGWVQAPLLPDRMGKALVSGGDAEMALRVGRLHPVWYNPGCQLQHCIPPHRTTKAYLRRMLRGLGASRHHTEAMKWKRPLAWWWPYALVYALGLLGYGLVAAGKNRKASAGLKVYTAPFFGWCSGLWALSRSSVAERRRLLGALHKTTGIKGALLRPQPQATETV